MHMLQEEERLKMANRAVRERMKEERTEKGLGRIAGINESRDGSLSRSRADSGESQERVSEGAGAEKKLKALFKPERKRGKKGLKLARS